MGIEGIIMLHTIDILRKKYALKKSKRRELIYKKKRLSLFKVRYVKKVEISDKDLLIIKEKIKTKIKKDRRKHLVFSVVLLSVFIFIVVHYWNYIF